MGCQYHGVATRVARARSHQGMHCAEPAMCRPLWIVESGKSHWLSRKWLKVDTVKVDTGGAFSNRPAEVDMSSHDETRSSENAETRGDGLDQDHKVLTNKGYRKELKELQAELVKLQEWVQHTGFRMVAIFEGRDTAGKGGSIKRITETLNPRYCRVAALGVPTERERSQWYFQRYVAELPAAGEIVLFDRSWYNRAGVEKVMGFCSDDEYEEFFQTVPDFERALVRSGILVVKYWLSISDDEQEKRFKARMEDPSKQWKLSKMDLEARSHWVDYAEAKDVMIARTDIPEARWNVVDAEDKKTARLNLIAHFLGQVPYVDLPDEKFRIPERQQREYQRPPFDSQNWIPTRYEVRRKG